MDGSLRNLLENPEYNAQSNLPFQIANRLMIALLCVQNNGYDYTDLKSANVLYRCYIDNKLVISLGDLGSLHRRGSSDPSAWTAKVIESHFSAATYSYSLAVVFIYGLLILEVYRIVKWSDYSRLPSIIPLEIFILHYEYCLQMETCGNLNDGRFMPPGPLHEFLTSIDRYYDYIRDTTMPYINGRLDILNTGTNYDEIQFIKRLLSRIFVRQNERLTFVQINTEFTDFNARMLEEGVPPEPDQMIDCRSIEDPLVCGEIDGCVWNPDSGECTSD